MGKHSIESIHEIIARGKTFAIITHVRPDGDAISSSLAMFWNLIDSGKNKSDIDVIIPEFISDFSFMPGIEYLKKSPTKEKYDVVIIVDCSFEGFITGIDVLKHAENVICFDHHENSTMKFKNCIINPAYPSCTCIIYEFFRCTDERFLNCIAVGLISDTANLTLNQSEMGKKIINELKISGIDTDGIVAKLTMQSHRTVELTDMVKTRGYFVGNSEHCIYCSYLLQSDLIDSEKNLNTVNHKAIISELQKTVPYTTLILLIENEKGEFKGSLRTFNTDLDFISICSKLVAEGKLIKGGGHSYSAGCTSHLSHDETFQNIINEIL